jgi:hypothetical protein
VIAIAQFPLQVAATSTLYVYLGVVVIAWGYHHEESAAPQDGADGLPQDP